MLGSPNANEAANAREKLNQLLAKHSLTWNDLPAILADIPGYNKPSPAKPQPTEPPSVNVLDLVLRLVDEHIGVTADERMAIALWVLHTYVYDRYYVTRHASPCSVPFVGAVRTALMILLELLAWEPDRNDSITAASIYYDRKCTVLADDEGDNLDLLSNPVLRTVFQVISAAAA
jgi:hypothetical protein